MVEQFTGLKKIPTCYGSKVQQTPFMNGWIIDFFLLNSDNEYLSENLESSFKSEFSTKKSFEKSRKGVTFDSIPQRFWKAPFVLEYGNGPNKGKRIPLEWKGRFDGVLSDKNIFRPQISFVVIEGKEVNKQDYDKEDHEGDQEEQYYEESDYEKLEEFEPLPKKNIKK